MVLYNLKGQSNEIFVLYFIPYSNLPGPLTKQWVKIFLFWLRIRGDIQIFGLKNWLAGVWYSRGDWLASVWYMMKMFYRLLSTLFMVIYMNSNDVHMDFINGIFYCTWMMVFSFSHCSLLMVTNRSHLTLLMVFNRLHITLLMVFNRLHTSLLLMVFIRLYITLLMVFDRLHITLLMVFNRLHT